MQSTQPFMVDCRERLPALIPSSPPRNGTRAVRLASGYLLVCCAMMGLARADDPAGKPVEPAAAPVSFHRQVMPILQRHCQGCHQPAKAQGKLDLTAFEAMSKGGQNGAMWEAGKPEESLLIDQISGEKPLMPPNAPALAAGDVELIRRWIAEGARDDTPTAAKDVIDAEHPPIYALPPLVTALAYSPDGQYLAVSGYREVLIHKADGSGLVKRLVGQSQRVESLVFSPDGGLLAVVGGSPGRFGEVQFWATREWGLKLAVRATYDTLYGGAFTPDGERFAFGGADNSARVIQVKDGKQTLKIDHHADWVFSTAYTQDGKHLITLGRDGAIKLTEHATGSFIDDIGKNYGELKVLARHPKEDRVLIGGDERVPRLYQVVLKRQRDFGNTDFNLLRAFETQPAGTITAVAFSPDGTRVAVGSSSGDVPIYKVEDGSRLATLSGWKGGVYAVAFAPDGARVALGGYDGQVRLFDVADGKLVKAFVPVPLQAASTAAR